MSDPVHAPHHLPLTSSTRRAVRRGPLRRFAETRGLVRGLPPDRLDVRLRAADGVRLVGSYLPGPVAGGRAVLLAHGFAANRHKPAYARLAAGLATVAGVLTVDLRGHGGSGGASTFGDRERYDVAAGVRWLTGFGHTEVVAVGASMGATSVLHAVANDVPVAAVVTISGPARFRSPAPPGPLRGLETLWHSTPRRRVLRAALGIHLAPPTAWGHPPDPVDLVAGLRAPLLVVHGHDDAYFPLADARELVAAAPGPSVLWDRPPGFGHAEDGFDARFVGHLARAVGSLDPAVGFEGWPDAA
jgi:pimeloyl-ACP methyl ester carboxylesterase